MSEESTDFYTIIEAPDPDDRNKRVKLGVRHETVKQLKDAQLWTSMALLVDVVGHNLPFAAHVFRGLKRPLFDGKDMNADQDVVIYSFTPEEDVYWVNAADGGYSSRLPPPPGRTFVVLVKLEKGLPNGVVGTIEHWNWVHMDPILHDAPDKYGSRYSEKVW